MTAQPPEPVDDDIDEAEPPSDKDLANVATLARRQIEAELRVVECTLDLKKALDELKAIQENELPTAVLALGLREFRLADGSAVDIETTHHASITKATQAAAFAWLEENGHDDIIKRTVTMYFGRGETEEANEAGDLLRKLAPENKLQDKSAVHGGTLKKFVADELKAGTDIPADVFNIFTRTAAIITPPGQKKKKSTAKSYSSDDDEDEE